MLWEHKLQISVSTAFLSFPNFHKCFYNTENIFSISFRKHCCNKKEKHLVYLDHQSINSLCSSIISSTAPDSSVFVKF